MEGSLGIPMGVKERWWIRGEEDDVGELEGPALLLLLLSLDERFDLEKNIEGQQSGQFERMGVMGQRGGKAWSGGRKGVDVARCPPARSELYLRPRPSRIPGCTLPPRRFLSKRTHVILVYGLPLSAERCRPVLCTQARKLVTSSTSFQAILRSTRSLGMGVSPTDESKEGESAVVILARGVGRERRRGERDVRVKAVRTIHSILPDSTLRTLSTLT